MTRHLLAAALLLKCVGAAACPLCLGWGQPSIAQRLVSAPQAVLAVPTENASRFHVIQVIKGERTADGTVEGGYPRSGPASADAAPTNTKPLLLVSDDPLPTWVILGAIDTAQAGWLRALAAGKRAADMSPEEWSARVALVVPHLQDPEPLAADLAYAELGAAPYAALRTAKPHLDAAALRQWLADPQLAARQPLCLLLLGISGNAQDAATLEQRLQAAWESGDTANLGSMLAADLELRGAPGVGRVELSRRSEALAAGNQGGAARALRTWQRQRRHPARAGDPVLPGVHEGAPRDRRIRRAGPCGLAVLGRGAGLPRAVEVGSPAAVSGAAGNARLPSEKSQCQGTRLFPGGRSG
jgi:hypothetical protein